MNQQILEYQQALQGFSESADIAGQALVVSGFMAFVVQLLVYAGFIGLGFIVLRIGADLLIMVGVVDALDTFSGGAKEGKTSRADTAVSFAYTISSFKDKNDKKLTKVKDNPVSYLAGPALSIILLLSIVGLMISGDILRIGGDISAAAGAVIGKFRTEQMAPFIQAQEVDINELVNKLTKATPQELMSKYSTFYSAMRDAENRVSNDGSNESNYIAYYRAFKACDTIAGKLTSLDIDSSGDLGKVELAVLNFDTTKHVRSKDNYIFNKGRTLHTANAKETEESEESEDEKNKE